MVWDGDSDGVSSVRPLIEQAVCPSQWADGFWNKFKSAIFFMAGVCMAARDLSIEMHVPCWRRWTARLKSPILSSSF